MYFIKLRNSILRNNNTIWNKLSISEKWGFLIDNPVTRLPYKELEPWHYFCDNIVQLLK